MRVAFSRCGVKRSCSRGTASRADTAFGNYTDPSPLRTIPGIGPFCSRTISSHPPAFETVPNIWQGLRPDGTPKTVDTLAAELDGNIRQGSIATGDWLIYEDAGEVNRGIHPAPWPLEKGVYLNYRQSLRDMVHAVEDVVDRSHIVFMTMFDYDPRSPRAGGTRRSTWRAGPETTRSATRPPNWEFA